jgi:hypothetical protein
MKKLLALSLMLASTLSYADNTKVQIEPKIVHQHLKLERIKNNISEVLQDYSSSSLLGIVTPFSSVKTISYLQECHHNPRTQEVEITPNRIETGLKTYIVVDKAKDKGQYLVNIHSSYNELVNINKVALNDCTIETPTTRELSFTKSYTIELNKDTTIFTGSFFDVNPISGKQEESIYKLTLEINDK